MRRLSCFVALLASVAPVAVAQAQGQGANIEGRFQEPTEERRIEAEDDRVEVAAVDAAPEADATIVGTADRLLAFVLGRAPLEHLQVRGDRDHAAAFLEAFPGP